MSLICQLILSLGRDRISPKLATFPPCVCVCCVYLQTLWYLEISGLSLDTQRLYLDLSGQISGFIWTHIWTQRLYLDYHGSTWSTYRKRPYVSVQTPAQGFILDQRAQRYTHCIGWRQSSNEQSSSSTRSILDLAGQYLIFKGEVDERVCQALINIRLVSHVGNNQVQRHQSINPPPRPWQYWCDVCDYLMYKSASLHFCVCNITTVVLMLMWNNLYISQLIVCIYIKSQSRNENYNSTSSWANYWLSWWFWVIAPQRGNHTPTPLHP